MTRTALISSLLSLSACYAQVAPSTGGTEATVVVFTPGSHWRGTGEQFKTLLFGKADMASYGEFFDGTTRIAYLTHSRYLILRLPPGEHSFSGSMSKKRPNKVVTKLNLAAGSTTYLALTATLTNYGLGVYATVAAHLDDATCREFMEDQRKNHGEPVLEKHITESYRVKVATLADLPACTE